MKTRGIDRIVLAAALSLGTAAAMCADSALQKRDTDSPEKGAAVKTDRFGAALADCIRSRPCLSDVEMEVWWRREGGIVSSRISGDGIGIWNDEVQFTLSNDAVLLLLSGMQKAGFGDMQKLYGGAKKTPSEEEKKVQQETRDHDAAKPPRRPRPNLRGAIRVRVGTLTKRVAQLMGGEQFATLATLAGSILDVSDRAAKDGVRGTTFADALEKLSTGTLAPESLRVTVQRKADKPGPGAEDGSWILRVEGRRVVDQVIGGKPQPLPRLLVLSPAEFQSLARLLASSDPAAWPKNPYAPQYTDLNIRVLKNRRSLAGRRYLGVTPTSHGAAQGSFDASYAAFLELHRRAEKSGEPLRMEDE